jgi:hypothetical protein
MLRSRAPGFALPLWRWKHGSSAWTQLLSLKDEVQSSDSASSLMCFGNKVKCCSTYFYILWRLFFKKKVFGCDLAYLTVLLK